VIHAEERTDLTEVKDAIRSFANAPKGDSNVQLLCLSEIDSNVQLLCLSEIDNNVHLLCLS
jgi:hypothetical protein